MERFRKGKLVPGENKYMNKSISIFNDVIGPVMRGPSSSHTAASWRIARISLDILNEPLKRALIEFDKQGAWASNYREQGTTLGIDGGLLGLDITDERIRNADSLALEMGLNIEYAINSFPTNHANTVRLTLESKSGKKVQIVAISIGGGAFEIQQIDKLDVKIRGDYFELLIWKKKNDAIPDDIQTIISHNSLSSISSNEEKILINLKFSNEVPEEILQKLKTNQLIEKFIVIIPILSIVSGRSGELPFNNIYTLLSYAEEYNLDLGDLGILYEQNQSGLSKSEIYEKMKKTIKIIEESIDSGLKGSNYKDRILPQQSHLIGKSEKDGKILKNSLLNNIVAFVSAIMESKSAMEVIVANPTAGSCGTVGGALKAVAKDLNSLSEDLIKAYFAAGIIGAYFAKGPGFSAEEHGCQVECGAASGMAAAGIVQLMGGTAKQAVAAASMAIQNMIGLVCDPVADRVEVPCLGKNISAAMNALSSATMACSGFDEVIPLEEVIQTVSKVSAMMPSCNKCTGQGGLAITETSIQLKSKLQKYN